MKVVKLKSYVHSQTYDDIVKKAEHKVSNFFNIPVEELKDKVNYEYVIWESSNDGETLPIFTAEVMAQLKKEI